MEDKNKRKSIIYLIIGIVTLIALIAGATYAYFQAQTGNNAVANLNATTGTTDNLTFSTEGEIEINASADNFGENMGDQVSQASAIATLIPNNTTNKATETYNVYLVINENPFEYTKDEETPEIILSIKKDGVEYTGVKELESKEGITISTKGEDPNLITETIKGYDITEKRGLIKIAENEQITADGNQEIDNWEIRIILKNLDRDQNKNTGKTFNGKIIIQKEDIPTEILDVCESGENIANCLIKLHNESEYGITKLVYHDELEDYKGETNYTLEAGDSSYRYSGSSEEVNNYVCFGGDCSNNPEDPNYSNLYRIIGVFPTTATKDSLNKEYQLKIIKADYATAEELGGEGIGAYYGPYGSESTYKGNSTYLGKVTRYYWNREQNNSGDNTNDWSKSNLNTENLNKYLLDEYLKPKDDGKWYNMIEEHSWITAGVNWTKIKMQNAKTIYLNEIVNLDVGTALTSAVPEVTARVGLMYISDYMYGSSQEHWSKAGNNNGINDYSESKSNNWIYMGLGEWLITRQVESPNRTLTVHVYGLVSDGYVYEDNPNYNVTIRPIVYLKPDVKIFAGSGTSNDPYIISE